MSEPASEPVLSLRGFALTIDVEEWYHTCLVPEFIDPNRRPSLVEELDWLLPEVLEWLDQVDCTATFFVLGEVARKHPERVREIARQGHEVACHGYLHWRAGDLSEAQFAQDLARAKELLESLVGAEVTGFRAPEWSLREPSNPKVRTVARAGFRYDSSLAPVVGAGRWSNPRAPYRLRWADGSSLLELPPLTFAGPFRLPAGSWPGRLAPDGWVSAAASKAVTRRGVTTMVFHPWEATGKPTPGELSGFARFVHETGRLNYRDKLGRLLKRHRWQSIREVILAARGSEDDLLAGEAA